MNLPKTLPSKTSPSKTLSFALVATLAITLFVVMGLPAFGNDADHEKKVKVVMMLDDGVTDAHAFDADDMEVGEIRELEVGGKQIVLRRNEEGFGVEVDGEDLDGSNVRHKVIHLRRDGDVDIDIDDLDLSGLLDDGITTDSRVRVLRIDGTGGKTAAEHLEESGVLDGLSSSERDDILEVMRGYLGHLPASSSTEMFIHVGGDDDDEQ